MVQNMRQGPHVLAVPARLPVQFLRFMRRMLTPARDKDIVTIAPEKE